MLSARPNDPQAMNFHRLDLNLLVTLDVLLAERSVTRAAQRLNRSASATSEALGRLREFFEDELMTPVGRRMVPTPLGESLVEPLRQSLIQLRATVEARPAFDPAQSRRQFRLMLSDYVSTVLLPGVLRRLQQEAPYITFDLLPHLDEPWAALDRGEFDFLIVPDRFQQEGHPWDILFRDEYVCAIWADNPLVGEQLSLAQFLDMGHVQPSFGKQRAPANEEWIFARFGHERRVEVAATTFNAVPQLLVGTHRIATMHRRLAEFYVGRLPLRLLPPPVAMPPLVEIIQWHRYSQLDPGLKWLLGILKEVANERSPEVRAAADAG
jgi:DNA-binding transcriptional LysR family regulator